MNEAPGKAGGTPLGPAFLRFGISFGILAFLIWWLPTDRLWGAIERVPIGVWLFTVVGFILGHVLSALKWRILMSASGVGISIGEAVRAHAAGLFANLCLPSLVGGDVIRAALVANSDRGLARIAVASLADRLIDTFMLLLLAGLGVLFVPVLPDATSTRILALAAVAMPVGIVIGAVVVLRLPTDRLPAKLATLVHKIREALTSLLQRPGKAGLAALAALSIQSGFVLLNIGIARAIGIDLPVFVWFMVWPLAKIMALAPVSLGGIGVREVALAALLAPFGVESATAVAQSLCWEVVLVATGLMAGAGAVSMGAGSFLAAGRPKSLDSAGGALDAAPDSDLDSPEARSGRSHSRNGGAVS